MTPKNIVLIPIVKPAVSNEKVMSNEEKVKEAMNAERTPISLNIALFIALSVLFYSTFVIMGL